MSQVFNSRAPKKPTLISIDSELLEKARVLNIDLSVILEEALAEHVCAAQRSQWEKENAKAIQTYNSFVEENGVFSDGLRRF